jgi:hypothetical protein
MFFRESPSCLALGTRQIPRGLKPARDDKENMSGMAHLKVRARSNSIGVCGQANLVRQSLEAGIGTQRIELRLEIDVAHP